jgi:hypothetical protein
MAGKKPAAEPGFMIELASGEIVTVFAMFDDAGDPVDDRSQARQFGVKREDGSAALLRLHPQSDLEKIELQ